MVGIGNIVPFVVFVVAIWFVCRMPMKFRFVIVLLFCPLLIWFGFQVGLTSSSLSVYRTLFRVNDSLVEVQNAYHAGNDISEPLMELSSATSSTRYMVEHLYESVFFNQEPIADVLGTEVKKGDYVLKTNALRQLQGKLELIVEEVEGVSDARVLIVDSEDVEKTASVVIDTGDLILSSDGVSQIQSLVSNGVGDLRHYNVSVVDNHGNILSDRI